MFSNYILSLFHSVTIAVVYIGTRQPVILWHLTVTAHIVTGKHVKMLIPDQGIHFSLLVTSEKP